MAERDSAASGAARPRWPSYVFAAVLAAWFGVMIINSRTLAPIRCGETLTPDNHTVVMLSASWCGYCRAARRFLQGEKIKYCEYDIETDAEGRRRFARQPVKMIPLLFLDDQIFIGFNRLELLQALSAKGLRELRD